jgi:protocatechuate 3,4-dioxygenase beta subunit
MLRNSCGAANPGCRRLSSGARAELRTIFAYRRNSADEGVRPTFALASLLLVLCASLPAQLVLPGAAPASVSGVVTNSLTGEPVLRAHVVLHSYTVGPDGVPQTYGALTNQEGKFTITQLPPGRYVASADRAGFVMLPKTVSALNFNFPLAAGDKKEDLNLILTPAGAIIGRVLDAAGEPVANALVQAEGNEGGETAATDEQGRYRIGGLRPGKYRLHASPRPSQFSSEVRTDGSEDLHYSSTYYPDSLARASARRLDVGPAAELSGIDIRLVRTGILSVSGKVSGMPGGVTPTGIEMTREGENGYGGPQSTVKPDGSFTISPMDPGKYTLAAVSYGRSPLHNLRSAPVEIEVAGTNLEHIELRMIPPFEVPGQVRFDDERARLPQQRPARQSQPPAAQPAVPPLQIHLKAVLGFQGDALAAEIGADDSFTLENVLPGRFHVLLSWGPAYVRSVRIGSTETEGDILDVCNGPAGPVTIAVSSLMCQISGTVYDSNGPAANIRVVLVPEAGGGRGLQSTPVKADGTYSFVALPPGKYTLAATDADFNPNRYERGVALEDYEDVAESIDLRPGDKITKDLKRK